MTENKWEETPKVWLEKNVRYLAALSVIDPRAALLFRDYALRMLTKLDDNDVLELFEKELEDYDTL